MLGKNVRYGMTTVAGSAALILALGGTAFAAGNGYAPPAQATGTAPGGYSQVVLNQSIPTNGGSLTATSNGSDFSAQVPAADAGTGVTLAITAPTNLANANNAILGFGIALAKNGVGVSGTFAAPITVTITNPNIKAGEIVDYWTGSSWAPYANAKVSNGSVTVTVTSDPQFALVSAPVPTPVGTPIPNSTTPHTGVPVEGLLLVAGVALLGGGLATTRAIRLRRHSA
ncbi:hypothetical protein [Ferrimicrobium acidiphilum]|uniref:hypothetical protein n=1 Tax=Ferrimicrobium acidiphilum TaxID=121039 RepID=UPI0023F1E0FA|nr:hypothetical protein [Ferrimicrobium acidiphilum]